MPGGVALGVEGVGIGELTWVAVGRAPCQQHARTLRDDGGPDVIIDPRCAIEALDRPREPQLLFDGETDEVRSLPEQRPLITPSRAGSVWLPMNTGGGKWVFDQVCLISLA
jgi:hypothetical protein